MDLQKTIIIAKALMKENGLDDWSLGWTKRKRALGSCSCNKKLIKLNINYVLYNTEAEIIDTIKHEIAHALAGAENGHNQVWKMKAKELGCVPRRASKNPVKGLDNYNFKYTCPNCRKIVGTFRRFRVNHSCSVCGDGKYNPKYILIRIK